ncbi:hypothetical protein Acr_24g0014030 [Actinidia rufa]|uniref:Uncharacterized protein n=1 Tax=Actinidia rufa TaxID=165716 RepID=A0A7J0GWP0_9ERIC|nr:hypothetical protein Acr_24g0014030 [Actinidia rufa]
MLKLANTKGLKPTEYGALKDCLDQIEDSVNWLIQSAREIEQLGLGPRRRVLVACKQCGDVGQCSPGPNGHLRAGLFVSISPDTRHGPERLLELVDAVADVLDAVLDGGGGAGADALLAGELGGGGGGIAGGVEGDGEGGVAEPPGVGLDDGGVGGEGFGAEGRVGGVGAGGSDEGCVGFWGGGGGGGEWLGEV